MLSLVEKRPIGHWPAVADAFSWLIAALTLQNSRIEEEYSVYKGPVVSSGYMGTPELLATGSPLRESYIQVGFPSPRVGASSSFPSQEGTEAPTRPVDSLELTAGAWVVPRRRSRLGEGRCREEAVVDTCAPSNDGHRQPGTISSLLRIKLTSQDTATHNSAKSCLEKVVENEEGFKEPSAADGNSDSSMPHKLGPGDFEFLCVVGQGSFGKVFQVKKKDTGKIYAMKVMRKDRILEKDHARYVLSEKNALTAIDHPYIVRIFSSFQTSKKLYLVLDFIDGGHLFYQLFKLGVFSEDRAKMYTAEIVSAISFLHSKGILHRDLKPENVLLDSEGHIKITDFGLCKANMNDTTTRADSFVGTIQYMAPEIIKGQQHTEAVDWWSVGILLYEMLSGNPPFDFHSKKGQVSPKDRNHLMKRILNAKLQRPKFCSKNAWSLLRGLLTRDPSHRLGARCTNEIKNHNFFWGIDWGKLDKREMVSPFKPNNVDSKLTANFEKRYTDLPPVDSPCGTPDCPGVLGAFQGYSYQAPSPLEQGLGRLEHF